MASKAMSSEEAGPFKAAEDYAMGWYLKQPDRIGNALHDELVKRTVDGEALPAITKATLVQLTRDKEAEDPEEKRTMNIRVHFVRDGCAALELEMHDWFDYMHLAKCGDEWKIVNVLWKPKASP
jgi:hypothetical protein